MTGIQSMWGWEPAVYLFLGGLAGGTFLISSLVRLVSKDRFPRLSVAAPWVSFATLAVGLVCLVIEVEKPLQAMMMWQSFVNFGSWMTIGAWLLFAALAVFFVCAVFSTPQLVKALQAIWKPLGAARDGVVKVTMVIGMVLGFLVAVYTGVLLNAAGSIPLWNMWLIPVLFTVSALDVGASVTVACLLAEKKQEIRAFVRGLQVTLIAFIVLEGVVLAALLLLLLGGTTSQMLSASTLVEGALNLPFWCLVVVVGLVVPFVLGVLDIAGLVKRKELSTALHIVAIVCALVGSLALRYVILAAGVHGVLVSPDSYQAMMDVFNLMP